MAEGVPIGQTDIVDKPFKPGWYTFIFQLTGYQDAERKFYITPSLKPETFTQALTPATAGQPIEKPGSSSTSHLRVNWIYVALVAIIVILLIALVARRR
jgi:hypothetical protein